ncbi:MAG: hypothetical protein GX308_03195 [Epulopiscium sp.]|nr:hypothetical protein [Candidatus Epulonipiscium sp.]
MSNKKNRTLIGIIIVVIGLFSLVNQWIRLPFINANNLLLLFVATALILLYYTKKETWALVVGTITGFFGILGVFPNIHINTATFIAPSVFIMPGIIFMVLYFSKRNIGLLVPASILIWFGIFVFLIISGIARGMMVPAVFFGSMGASFVSMYILGYPKIGKWPLIPGGILLLFGFMFFAGVSAGFIVRFMPKLIPVILIFIGLFIVVKGRKSQ